jgi:tetratricopeptide (TPR) repeat protein
MNILLKILTFTLTVLFLVGCAARRPPVPGEEPVESQPHPQALDHFIRGVVYDQQGEITRAISEYRRALKYDSTSASIYLALAEDYFALKLYEDALSHLYTGLNYDTLNIDILQFLSDLLLRTHQADSAIHYLNRLVTHYPEESQYHHNLATLYLRLNRVDEAIAQYEDCLEYHPEDRESLTQLGTLYITQDDFYSALDTALELFDLDSEDDRVCFTIASLYAELERPADADSFFARAVQLNPDDPRYFTNWAFMLLNQDEPERAAEILDRGTFHHPTSADIWSLLGSAYQQADQDSLALEALNVSLELDASNIGTYITLGFIYDVQGEIDKAIEVYDQALTISPDDPLLLNNYAYLLAQKGERLNEALEMVTRALEQSPESASYLDTKGWIYYALGEYDKAKDYIEQALVADPDNWTILDHLGDVCLELGDKAQARQFWRQALEYDPENVTIREKLAR